MNPLLRRSLFSSSTFFQCSYRYRLSPVTNSSFRTFLNTSIRSKPHHVEKKSRNDHFFVRLTFVSGQFSNEIEFICQKSFDRSENFRKKKVHFSLRMTNFLFQFSDDGTQVHDRQSWALDRKK